MPLTLSKYSTESLEREAEQKRGSEDNRQGTSSQEVQRSVPAEGN